MKRLLPILMALFLCAACREPLSTERFILGEGPYVFTLDLQEGASYDFDLYTRVDASPSELSAARELPLDLYWMAPSGALFREKVYLPLTGRSSLFSRQVYHPYRADVRPQEFGQWTVSVVAPDTIPRRGLGLVMRTIPDQP